jgi:DNA replicative helicase MCM subunit Mcm2 (Cdc46/Mcm family)
MDPETDRKIATHVIRGHRYRNDHGQTGHDSDYDDDDSDLEDHAAGGDASRVQSVWQRGRYQTEAADGDADAHSADVLQHEFLRKFIHFAKTRMQPILTDAAREFIANRYAEMRARQDERTLPITARSLETVIRLATAHAKARLSDVVEAEPDCETAMDILGFALYHENGDSSAAQQASEVAAAVTKRRVVTDDGESDTDTDGLPTTSSLEDESPNKRSRTDPVATRQENDLKTKIWNLLLENGGDLAVTAIDPQQVGAASDAIQTAIDALNNDGRVMVSDGIIYNLED